MPSRGPKTREEHLSPCASRRRYGIFTRRGWPSATGGSPNKWTRWSTTGRVRRPQAQGKQPRHPGNRCTSNSTRSSVSTGPTLSCLLGAAGLLLRRRRASSSCKFNQKNRTLRCPGFFASVHDRPPLPSPALWRRAHDCSRRLRRARHPRRRHGDRMMQMPACARGVKVIARP